MTKTIKQRKKRNSLSIPNVTLYDQILKRDCEEKLKMFQAIMSNKKQSYGRKSC